MAKKSREQKDIADVIGTFAAKVKKGDTSNGSGLRKRTDEKGEPETKIDLDVSVSNI